MDIDPLVTLAGAIVGFVVGLTGMGGGALMTPVLVLLFGVHPLAAVSSDLVASAVMKPVGAGVHLFRGTVHRGLVGWLMLGSVPAAFGGVFVLRSLGDGDAVQHRIQIVMGAILIVAAAAMLAKSAIDQRRGSSGLDSSITEIRVRVLPTVVTGAIGGLVVGMTSVGSGSLIIVLLLALYPRIRGSQLVGTDLAQAVPLVAAASLGHLLFGDFQLGLTSSLLIGALPGVYLGARVSAGSATSRIIRPALVVVVTLSGLKLLGVPTDWLGITLAAAAAGGLARLAARHHSRTAASVTPIAALDARDTDTEADLDRLSAPDAELGRATTSA
ncbi:sulfite exporter TauE/SafE family protein [Pseudofrankia sp. BMG5.37]|uniref:sulfite exporter TauE/SafE family protein n=1 Tax=Pseudofrankia sp. BMG5.37 TaxID=3050035 RepID=UPI002895310B|nr:sulfite exporter TauE/SafE family protein [Pseudofrankia sp. BMG5.37]MDT3445837.1 sulfite exporter TauE/SafE family protein [Pseudofrankia sp. BMG5.37]